MLLSQTHYILLTVCITHTNTLHVSDRGTLLTQPHYCARHVTYTETLHTTDGLHTLLTQTHHMLLTLAHYSHRNIIDKDIILTQIHCRHC